MEGASANAEESPAVYVNTLQYAYPGQKAFISGFTLKLEAGSRCLLIGANGAGKTTLLKILAGKHMVGGKDVVRVLGRSAFHDTALTCDGSLGYLGGSWSRSVGSAGDVPLQGDFSAEHMIFGVADVDAERRARLIELLDIDLRWRMHKVSDGQRRRVQICMGLLRPFQVMLLDEITVDLDVVARMDLLNFFVEECEQRGATIIYATHIFDGLEAWATHLAYVENGTLKRAQKLADLVELHDSSSSPDSMKKNLISVVEPWLRSEQEERHAAALAAPKKVEPEQHHVTKPAEVSPWTSSRQMAYYR
eukprot:jgi/Mesen1/9946/ME000071S09370